MMGEKKSREKVFLKRIKKHVTTMFACQNERKEEKKKNCTTSFITLLTYYKYEIYTNTKLVMIMNKPVVTLTPPLP